MALSKIEHFSKQAYAEPEQVPVNLKQRERQARLATSPRTAGRGAGCGHLRLPRPQAGGL